MAGTGVASIGECMLGLSGQIGPNWRMGFAGDTFNTLWALHALSTTSGRQPMSLSAFGDDPNSQGQIDFFAENGIGIGSSPVIAGARPGLYAITLTGAERSFTYWRSDAAARQLASDPDRTVEKPGKSGACVLFRNHLGNSGRCRARSRCWTAVAKARAAGSADRLRPQLPATALARARASAQAAIVEALAVTDIALPTFPDEQMLFGDATPQATAAAAWTMGRRGRRQERRSSRR